MSNSPTPPPIGEDNGSRHSSDDYYVIEFKDPNALPTVTTAHLSSWDAELGEVAVDLPLSDADQPAVSLSAAAAAAADETTSQTTTTTRRVVIDKPSTSESNNNLTSLVKPTTTTSNFMALSVKVFRLTGVTEPRQSYYVALDFKTSMYKSNPIQASGDSVKINQVFSWPLGTPLEERDILSIKLYRTAMFGSDKYVATLPISLQQVIELKRIEVEEQFVNEETSQPTPQRIEMEIIYASPGNDEGMEAMQKALLEQMEERYDTVSDMEKKKKSGLGALKSKLGIKSKKKPGREDDNISVASRPSIQIEEEFMKFEQELREMPSADTLSHRKRIDRMYRCRNYDALQTRSYQVHVTVFEGRQLSGQNIDPVVTVTIGGEKKSTAVKTSTNIPYFNEFMLFDLRMPQQALLEQVITVTAWHSRKLLSDEMIGQFRVDVATVFRHPDHTIGHKWVQLVDPEDLNAPPKGFIKLALAVVTKGDMVSNILPTSEGQDDNIEKNLFTMSSNAGDLWQTARYNLRIYQAEQLPSASGSGFVTGFKRALKSGDSALLDPFVTATFAGQQGKTSVKRGTIIPEWNEQISFHDMFPPPCRRIILQLRDSGISDNLIACHYFDLYMIANEGKSHSGGYLPTFGPAWVNLYGALDGTDEQATQYGDPQAFRGRILLELTTELVDQPEASPIMVVTESVPSCDKSLLPVANDFLMMGGVHSVDMVHPSLIDKQVTLQLSLGPYPDTVPPPEVNVISKSKSSSHLKHEESSLLSHEHEKVAPVTPTFTVKADESGDFGVIPMQSKKPLLAIRYSYGDHRKHASCINMLEKILAELDEGIYRARSSLRHQEPELAVAQLTRILKSAIVRGNTFNRLSKSSSIVGRHTRLFDCWLKQCRESITEVVGTCSKLKQNLGMTTVSETISSMGRLCLAVEHLLAPREQDFQELFVWLITTGQEPKKVGYVKIPLRTVTFSEVPEEAGNICGKMETFKLMSPDRENMHMANLMFYSWHGLFKDWSKAFENIPKGVMIPPTIYVPPSVTFKESMRFQLRSYLYQARGIRGLDDTGLSDPFAVVHFQESSIKTRVINETLSPIWDETMVTNDIEVFGNRDFIRDRPPIVTLNVYDYDDPESYELIGVAYFIPHVRFAAELRNYTPPNLQWFRLISPRTFADAGEVLAAAELLQVEGEGDGRLPYLDIPDDIPSDSPMPVPRGIRPTLSRYRIEILFWGLRELARLQLLSVDRPRLDIELSGQTIQSDVIQRAQSFPNFTCLIKAIEMDLPDNNIFCPPLMLRCVDCRSFGRQLLVGAAAIPNISAFFIGIEDDAQSVNSSSIVELDDPTPLIDLEGGDEPGGSTVGALARSISKQGFVEEAGALHQNNNNEQGTLLNQHQQQQQGDDYLVPTASGEPGKEQQQHHHEGAIEATKALIEMAPLQGSPPVAGQDGLALSDDAMLEVDMTAAPTRLKGQKFQRVKIHLRLPPEEEEALEKLKKGINADEPIPEKKPVVVADPADPAGGAANEEDEEETDWWTKYYLTVDELRKAEMESTSLAGKTLFAGGFAGKSKLKLFANKAGKGLKALGIKDLRFRRFGTSPGAAAYANEGFDGQDEHDAVSIGHGGAKDDVDSNVTGKSLLKLGGKKKPKRNVRTFRVYNSELESLYNGFEDFIRSFELRRGKEDEDADPAQKKSLVTGKFKGNIRVSRLDQSLVGQRAVRDESGQTLLFPNIPPSNIVPLVVRVYVVRAFDLYPKDMNGKSDPYITIRLGKTVIKDKDNYVSKQLNPIFGRCFEIKATLPFDNMLSVQIYDWDLVGSDDLIGETKIDIENRFYSRHRPTVGIPLCYEKQGYNAWRDTQRPTHLLSALCRRDGLDLPIYEKGKVIIGKKVFIPSNWDNSITDGNEHLALAVLHSWDKYSGYKLVPEHIETRLLFDPAQPGQIMGHLEMWVDMFPSDKGQVPPPIDISPRKPKSYELRCIIWNTEDVILDDVSITGEKMSDIYVKGFLTGPQDCQQTDVHYRSLTGEGNFNWRFVYKFDYLSAEQKIVVKRKENLLSWDETEEKLPARLTLQVWDADLVSADDFLGSLILDLNNLPRGAKDGKNCTADMVDPENIVPMTSIFKQRRMRGFWPFTVKNETTQEIELTGKVEAEFMLLTAEEAAARPAGLGRDPPDQLDKPNRPDTSFQWFLNPFKSLQYIICTKFKWIFLKALIVLAIAMIFILFVYNMPGYLSKKMIGA